METGNTGRGPRPENPKPAPPGSSPARALAFMAVMAALSAALSYLEHLLPPLPMLPPGVRLGLANIVVMYALFFLGRRQAAALAVLKAGMVLLLRGAMAGLLSLCGGLAALLAIAALDTLGRGRLSYLLLSVAGAVAHNLAQIAVASALVGTNLVALYLPAILAFGVLMGSATGTLLRVVLPLFGRIAPKGPPGL